MTKLEELQAEFKLIKAELSAAQRALNELEIDRNAFKSVAVSLSKALERYHKE